MKLKLASLLILATALLGAKHIKSYVPGWKAYAYSNSIPLTNLSGGGVSFAMPTSRKPDPNASGNWVEYLLNDDTDPLPLGGFIHVTVSIATSTPPPLFNWKSEAGNTCVGNPATFRPYFQRGSFLNGDDYTRWWANGTVPSAVQLQAGTFSLSIPIDPAQWSDTFGRRGDSSQAAIDGFNASALAPTYIGGTFGGGCFFSHGVLVSGGSATFSLLNWSAQ